MSRGEDPWRSVFNPGWNPNSRKAGNKIFDNVEDVKASPTTWDYILRSNEKAMAMSPTTSQNLNRSSSDISSSPRTPTTPSTVMDVHELRNKLANSDTLLEMSKTQDGKVDFERFCSMLKDQRS